MNPDELAETRAELEAFVDDVFASLPRADQRGKGSLYLRGLMLDGRRKSMQPMSPADASHSKQSTKTETHH